MKPGTTQVERDFQAQLDRHNAQMDRYYLHESLPQYRVSETDEERWAREAMQEVEDFLAERIQ